MKEDLFFLVLALHWMLKRRLKTNKASNLFAELWTKNTELISLTKEKLRTLVVGSTWRGGGAYS